jgi:K+-transporting ATPase ATPase A chain
MLLGEVVFGGLGTGLMIGRSPEYLGKQLTPREMKLVALYAAMAPLVILPLTALALVTDGGVVGLTTNHGAHGFSEILVAYTSSMANNGQTFTGLSANSPFYNITTALAMIAGRFGLAIPALALAGRFAEQPRRPTTDGSLPTDTAFFGGLVISTIIVIAALGYLPALALGPIVEHLALR